VAFIFVQNRAEFGAVVSIIRQFNVMQVWLKNAYSRPFFSGSGGLHPLDGTQYQKFIIKDTLSWLPVY